MSCPASTPPQKKPKEDTGSGPLLSSAAVAAAAAQFPIRPVLHAAAAAVAANATNQSPPTSGGRLPNFPTDLSLPFPRWMDYMWQTKPNSFQFAPYALPWLKRPTLPPFAANTGGGDNLAASPTAGTTAPAETKTLPTFNCSAFKPVLNNNAKGVATSLPTQTTYVSDDDQESMEMELDERTQAIKESLSSDDEMVDIETTEDDAEPQNLKHIIELRKHSPPLSPERLKEWKKSLVMVSIKFSIYLAIHVIMLFKY